MKSINNPNEKLLTPIVSIIIPVFNREKLINQAINTVINQTFQDWELILVDDRSTDLTASLIAERAKDEPRIKFITNLHPKGPSGARNQGLEEAVGKYIAYQDSDDEWYPHHLETMVYYLEKYPDELDLMSANPLRKYLETDEVFNYDTIKLTDKKYRKLEDVFVFDADSLFDIQLRGRAITTQCMVGKAEVMKAVKWNETLGAAEDNLHNLELTALKISLGHIQDYHTIYWAHDDNLSNCKGEHPPERMEKIHKAFVEFWIIILNRFKLDSSQERYVKNELAEIYVWHLGYLTLEKLMRYQEASHCYIKALKLRPNNGQYWIMLFKVQVKRIMQIFSAK
ncbi:glycosyltransferase family 2 protein [Paraglaciecola sp.]|uniref:glycosyltransferase family 2 protein n=1 Tax=Paraglaciecola sp. TaxID=1920173 RepID=UPI00273DEB7E|nr:glycosyltransferase family 2 protein [Paraglaciecola sp.]MDP5033268.1 glycosyltransferase [Paraglaciecola sp.]